MSTPFSCEFATISLMMLLISIVLLLKLIFDTLSIVTSFGCNFIIVMIRVFIGFDEKEVVSYNVLQHSINSRSTLPISITQINLRQLKGIFIRERNILQSTDFSFYRFLTPYLCNYQGWAIFMDCDMLFLDDITKLWNLRDDKYAVMCVRHDYKATLEKKFLNNIQTNYKKKNYSSLMLINCNKCRALTPECVNSASGLELHQFKWLKSDDEIGAIDKRWNYLVDEYEFDGDMSKISNLHYTNGGPYFEKDKNCRFAKEWIEERKSALECKQVEMV